jgi:hypothetical protein
VTTKPRPKPKTKPAPDRRGGTLWLALAVVGLAAVPIAFPPALALILFGMAPSMVAAIVDRTPQRAVTLTVGFLNLPGVLGNCIDLWRHAGTFAGAYQLLRSPWTWIVMYAGAALGWLVAWLLPILIREILLNAIDRREASLKALQKRLREEWGDEVAGG